MKTVNYGSSAEKERSDLLTRRAKTQKMVFYEGRNELGNSSSGKSSVWRGAIVIVDDAAKDISALYVSTGWSCLGDGYLLIDALVGTSIVVVVHELNHNAPQMNSIEYENVIQTFFPSRADPAF